MREDQCFNSDSPNRAAILSIPSGRHFSMSHNPMHRLISVAVPFFGILREKEHLSPKLFDVNIGSRKLYGLIIGLLGRRIVEWCSSKYTSRNSSLSGSKLWVILAQAFSATLWTPSLCPNPVYPDIPSSVSFRSNFSFPILKSIQSSDIML